MAILPDLGAQRRLFRPEGISMLLDQHLERRSDHRKPLFNLLALDLWCDQVFGEGAAVPVATQHTAAVKEASVL